MKQIKYILIGLYGILIMNCNSYLDQINPNALSSDAIGVQESDLLLLLNGCYNALQRGAVDGYQYLDGFSDVAYADGQAVNTITEGGGTPQTGIFQSYWVRHYRLIARCNELLSILSNIESSNDKIEVIEGETKFLRAVAYYYLTVLYKDVPLITTKQSFEDRFVSKNSQLEIKAQIISDLTDAIAVLPVNMEYPKVSKNAALALKAKVHAFFNEWNEVVSLTDQIISQNKYHLYPDYFDLFTLEAEGNEESIFSIPFETGVGLGESFSGSYPLQPFLNTIRPLPNYADAFYCTDGLDIFNSTLYDAEHFYENRDPRMDRSILRKGVIWSNGQPYDPLRSPTGYSIRKYVRNITMRGDGPLDFMLIRYADVLLLRAEALVETGNIGEEVYELINQVRERVDMPKVENVEGTALSQDKLREIIRHERLVELGLEGGIRWIDLKRWNIVDDVYSSIDFHNRVYDGEKTVYWPIPQSEIDNNPNMKQHDFWN